MGNKVIRTMVTTKDNPYDPFDDFRNWFTYDTTHGYNTCALLGRLTFSSEELSEIDQRQAIELIVDEIVSENISGMFIKVTKEVEE
jgi:hypothetical protein